MAASMDDRWASAIVGTVLLATGVWLFLGGLHERREASALRARGVVTDARVVETAAEPRILQVGGVVSAHDLQRVTFDFEDVQGHRHAKTLTFLGNVHTSGETVRLVYDPGAPEHAQVFKACTGWFSCDRVSLLSAALGAFMVLFTAGLLYRELS